MQTICREIEKLLFLRWHSQLQNVQTDAASVNKPLAILSIEQNLTAPEE